MVKTYKLQHINIRLYKYTVDILLICNKWNVDNMIEFTLNKYS